MSDSNNINKDNEVNINLNKKKHFFLSCQSFKYLNYVF